MDEEGILNTNDLYFLQNLCINEALMDYYHTLEDGMTSLFAQSKIAKGKFKIDGGSKATCGIILLGELIPEVGNILIAIGECAEGVKEDKIRQKLIRMSAMIKDDFKNSIAKDISGSLTVKRRSYITNLTFQDLKADFKNFD